MVTIITVPLLETNPDLQCWKCKGTGKFISGTGRVVGDCFSCNGTGRRKLTSEQQNKLDKENAKIVGYFPKTVKLCIEKNVKLHLVNAKVVMFQNREIALVAPIFGTGIYGYFDAKTGALRGNASFFKHPHKDEILLRLVDVESRGLEAVKAISTLLGHCCMCGRTLTNDDSINAGIGPICAGKMEGW